MQRFKTKSYREVEGWYDTLSSLNGKGNLIPWEGCVSKNRGMMFNNAATQYRAIVDGEVALVDTYYSYDIMQSTKNLFSDKEIVKVKTINKEIAGRPCAVSTSIVMSLDGEYDIIEFNEYEETGSGYGIKMINDIDKYEEGEIIPKGTSLIRTNSYGSDMEYQWGINAMTVLGIDIKSIEDSGSISQELADRMQGWAPMKHEIIVDVNSDVLKNLYGNSDAYKPFPLPGEKVENELLIAISKHQRNAQFIKTGYGIQSVSKTDSKLFVRGKNCIVTDITVRQPLDEVCYNTYLAALIDESRKYESDIFEVMKECMETEDATFTKDFMDKYLFLQAIFEKKAGYKYKKIVGGHNVVLEISTVDFEVPEPGQKNTGRCGNKFTTSEIFPTGKYFSDDGNIDYMGNCLALFNRAIMEVPLEMYANRIGIDIFNAINSGLYTKEYMIETILGMLEILDYNLYVAYKEEFDAGGYEEFVADGKFRWYLDTYNCGFNIKTGYYAYKYLQTRGIKIERKNVYVRLEDGTARLLGQAMVSRLFIMPLKQVADTQLSLRAQGAYDTRGIIIRTDGSRYRNSPCRKSSLLGDIQANSLHPDDLKYINKLTDQESIELVDSLLYAMGVELHNPQKEDNVQEEYL